MSSPVSWRLELFFKSKKELQERIVPFLKENSIKRVNLTNKTKEDQLLECCRIISSAVPSAEICVHYSLKWNYSQSVEQSFQAFANFCATLAEDKQSSMLLVSGGGKKRKLDSVEALQRAAACESIRAAPPIHVAFNPYFPSKAEAAEERKRLTRKLDTGLVRGIYLQMGTDMEKLKQALHFLKDASRDQHGNPMDLFGSVFLPTKRLLAQMRFRPWNGVFLSEEYLSSVDKAQAITAEILAVYSQHGVVPLVESKICTTQELRQCLDLLEGCHKNS
ncbi:hypothetical protein COCOBI_02-8180 [Coccomyxa sp. Obi]|nr:hypothetical protein COCOBI_02-8180 [Coccomyxa sp. Obi]